MKIHPHITKAAITYVAIVLVASLGIWFYVSRNQSDNLNPEGRKELPTPAFKVSEYSLSGKVVTIKDSVITLNVTRIFVGDNGNYQASEEKTFTITPKTPVSLVTTASGKVTTKVGKISDIKVGQNITVYSNKDIARQDSFFPSRIDILLTK